VALARATVDSTRHRKSGATERTAHLGKDRRRHASLNVHAMRHHPYFFPRQGDPRFEALLNDPKNNAPLF